VTPVGIARVEGFLIELSPLHQQLRIAREERLMDQSTQTRELIRNLGARDQEPSGGAARRGTTSRPGTGTPRPA